MEFVEVKAQGVIFVHFGALLVCMIQVLVSYKQCFACVLLDKSSVFFNKFASRGFIMCTAHDTLYP